MSDSRVVVITVDGSDNSLRAFNWYVAQVMRSTDTVYCLHVPEKVSLPVVSSDAPLSFPTDVWIEKIKGRQKKVEDLGNVYEYKLQELKLKGGFFPHDSDGGSVGQTVCDFAAKKKATLIVMGNRGLSAIRRTFLGSVSDYVIHHAGMPVIIVPPETTS